MPVFDLLNAHPYLKIMILQKKKPVTSKGMFEATGGMHKDKFAFVFQQ